MSRYVEHTETEGRPLVKAYTRREARHLFRRLQRLRDQRESTHAQRTWSSGARDSRKRLSVDGAKLRLESYHHGNQVTSPKYPTKPSAQSTSLREKASSVESETERQPAALLLDLSGDKSAAISWASDQFPTASIRLIDKGELKWESKREALARIRAMKPRVFAIFTSDLQAQSARGSIVLFAALCGARRIVIGDGNGRAINRSRASALVIEGARLILEFLFGYLLIVPLSWLLTKALGAALVFRKTVRASRSNSNRE